MLRSRTPDSQTTILDGPFDLGLVVEVDAVLEPLQDLAPRCITWYPIAQGLRLGLSDLPGRVVNVQSV